MAQGFFSILPTFRTTHFAPVAYEYKPMTAPDEGTYIALLVHALEARAPDETVFIHRDRDVSAGAFLASINRYARALSALGVTSSDVVALLAPNDPEAIAIRYAANLLGAATCYLSAPATEAARRTLIEQIAPTVLVVFPETVRLLPSAIPVATMAAGDCGPSFRRLDGLAAEQSPERVPCRARAADLASIASSGGSTGVPKGSCRDFKRYTGMVKAPCRPDRRQLVNGRLAYLSQALVDQTLIGSGCVVLRDGFDAADTLAQIEARRITDLFLVEPQLFELMDHSDVGTRDLSSLRTLVHIGASAPATLRRRARARLGPVVAHPYGASEQGLVSILSAPEHDPGQLQSFFCAGRVLPSVEIRFRRSDNTLAAPGEPGVIEIKSPAMAQGYRNQPALTAAVFQDGWFHSADLGFLDDQGYLHILGRADDIEWTGDRFITPTAIEDALWCVAGVKYAVVVVAHDRRKRIALVVPSSPSIARAECLAAVARELGDDVAESLEIVVADRVPLTEQGKPDRPAIRALGSVPA